MNGPVHRQVCLGNSAGREPFDLKIGKVLEKLIEGNLHVFALAKGHSLHFTSIHFTALHCTALRFT